MSSATSSFTYVIIGSGRQGTSAAYDLARFGDASRIVMVDSSADIANAAAARVNELIGKPVAEPVTLDVTDNDALLGVISGADVILSAVPYYFNKAITSAAIRAGVNMCDLGGHTGIVLEQLEFDGEAKAAGVSILPDCGMGPGLVNTVAVYAMELLDETSEVYIYDAGLPRSPKPPWNYQLGFHINGLTNEYAGDVAIIQGGKRVFVDALSGYVTLEVDPLGEVEGFIAAGGSTAPWTFEGMLETFETRILRYPGHYEWFRAYKELGLFSEEPIDVNGQQITPRDLFHTLLAPKIIFDELDDVCIMVSRGVGMRDGKEAEVTITLLDYADPETGFTGMERLTGWHASIMMIMQAKGEVPVGARALEALHLDGSPSATSVMDEIARRGISFKADYK